MQRHKIENDLIFYVPGQPGAVFTYKTGHSVDETDINGKREELKHDTGHNIGWIEDRRLCDRPPEWMDLDSENDMDFCFF
jgi:hypothetical protein